MSDNTSASSKAPLVSLDIVIVNWNAGDHLARTIESVAAAEQKEFDLRRVVVVDNASTDDSLRAAFGAGLPIDVISNDDNRGFGPACNQGARAGDSDYLLFLNPDVQLEPGSLDAAIASLKSDAQCAVVGIRLNYPSGEIQRSCARLPTLSSLLLRSTGLDQIGPLRRFGYPMREWDHTDTRIVDHVIGAFYLVRRSAFESVNGFDERFFVYMEDVDLSLRLKSRGHRILFHADASATHIGGATSEGIRDRRLFYSLAARLLYCRLHLGAASTWMLTASTLTWELAARISMAAARGSRSDAVATVRGYRLLMRHLLKR